MSQRIQQAVNQVRLTNVAVVRLKRNGKRFEIACYKNKVDNWRSGVETDIEEVLQVDRVFHNVSKGVVAKGADLVAAFGTDVMEAVCKMILDKGESQISEGERDMHKENLFRNVATVVSAKCINPTTMRPYPVSTIETAMKDTIHFSVAPHRSAKQQALEVIRALEQVMPIRRAQMLVRVSVALGFQASLAQRLQELRATTTKAEEPAGSGLFAATALLDPGSFRMLSEYVTALTPPGTLEVKDFSVQEDQEGDVDEAAGVAHAHGQFGQGALGGAASGSGSVPGQGKGKKGNRKKGGAKSASKEKEDKDEDDVDGAYAQAAQSSQVARNRKKQGKKKRKEERRAAAAQELEEDGLGEAEDKAAEAAGAAEGETAPVAAAAAAAAAAAEAAPAVAPAVVAAAPVFSAPAQPGPKELRCLTCTVTFGSDRTMQREHYRSDLHRLNLKLKMKQLPCMTEEEFSLLSDQERSDFFADYT